MFPRHNRSEKSQNERKMDSVQSDASPFGKDVPSDPLGNVLDESTVRQNHMNAKEHERHGGVLFSGILGFDCGLVESYVGSDKKLRDKGFSVSGGIPTLRGFAKISDLAKASTAKYKEYQRQKNQKHIEEITQFLEKCRAEAKFLPEVILSVTSPEKAVLRPYSHKALSKTSETLQGVINNLDYFTLEVEEGALSRVDGNHRLEAGTGKDYYIPFSIVVWGVNTENEENMLSIEGDFNNTESEAFLFYILNNTAKRLEAEENFKGLVQSKNWTAEELSLIHKQLPILKHFNEKYAKNPLLDKEYLPNPLSQICEVLTEIDDSNLDKDKFDALFVDATKLLGQSGSFHYCREQFSQALFQLAFYTRYKCETLQEAIKKLSLINEWLRKYKYTGAIFSKASKLFDVANQYIEAAPKTVFMAMKYKSDATVKDYNKALQRAVDTLSQLGGNVDIRAYPIMTGRGKSIDLIHDIYNKIEECSIFVADITEANPNVMFELGLARSMKKPIILVRDKDKGIEVPSDIKNDRYYSFSGITELEKLLTEHIQYILTSDYGMVFP